MIARAPNQERRGAAAKELLSLIKSEAMPSDRRIIRVRFLRDNDFANMRRAPEDPHGYVSSSRYPTLCDHVKSVQIQHTPIVRPRIQSETFSMYSFDAEWLKPHIVKKCEISRGLGAKRANGHPQWLVVHFDGFPHNRMIDELEFPEAIAACREVLDGTPHRFERVYLINGTWATEADWLGRVI